MIQFRKFDFCLTIKAVAVGFALLTTVLGVNLEVTELKRSLVVGAGENSALVAISFASYVFGLITTLIFAGGIADREGPKPIIMTAVAISIFSLIILLAVGNIYGLFASRILRGISVGLVLGASALSFFNLLGKNTLSINIHGVLSIAGLGGGGFFTLFFFLFAEHALNISIIALAAMQFSSLVLLVLVGNIGDVKDEVGTWAYPKFSVRASWAYLSIFMAWSLVGVMVTFVNGLIWTDLGRMGSALVIFLAVGLGGFVQPFFRNKVGKKNLRLGLFLGNLALVFLVIGVFRSSSLLLLVSASLCGISGLGIIYVNAMGGVLRVSDSNQAGLVSGFFLSGYIGLGLPCILIGFLSDKFGNLFAVISFATVYAVLTALVSNIDFCNEVYINYRRKLSV